MFNIKNYTNIRRIGSVNIEKIRKKLDMLLLNPNIIKSELLTLTYFRKFYNEYIKYRNLYTSYFFALEKLMSRDTVDKVLSDTETETPIDVRELNITSDIVVIMQLFNSLFIKENCNRPVNKKLSEALQLISNENPGINKIVFLVACLNITPGMHKICKLDKCYRMMTSIEGSFKDMYNDIYMSVYDDTIYFKEYLERKLRTTLLEDKTTIDRYFQKAPMLVPTKNIYYFTHESNIPFINEKCGIIY